MKTILHVSVDDKFVIPVSSKFRNDEHFDTDVAILVDNNTAQLKYVQPDDYIHIVRSQKDFKVLVQRKKYDFIFFYPLPPSHWNLLKYISNATRVIWWAWGYDLYSPYFSFPPLLKIEGLKKKTKEIYDSCFSLKDRIRTSLRLLKNFIPSMYLYTIRRRVLSRIDYFMPVLDVEWQMMKDRYPYFKAELWFYKHIIPESRDLSNNPDGNILVGNSASPYNNHCDIWDIIRLYQPRKGKFIFPLSYGDQQYKEKVKKYIDNNCVVLDSFLEPNEYWRIVESCSYAVFGSIRQHAVGNIYHCFQQGVKVFLYRESMAFQFFKEKNFVVFPIEDINAETFRTPLTNEQAHFNQRILRNIFEEKNSNYQEFINKVVDA